MKQVEYTIAHAPTLAILADIVTKKLLEGPGWQCQGSLAVHVSGMSVLYYQAMVRIVYD